jgi:hypothetical protein
MYAVEMSSCGTIFLPNFMQIGIGVQALLRFCLSNLEGCNVGITGGRDLCSSPLSGGMICIPSSVTVSSGI